MSITAFQGPLISGGFGEGSSNSEWGPSLFTGGSGILDPRVPVTYQPGQNFGSSTCGWLGSNPVLTLNVVPFTLTANLIAASQHAVANTPLTLASATATGIAVGVNGSLFGSATGATLVNALCIDPLVASVTASIPLGSNIMTTSAIATPGGVCYNQLAVGMVLSDSTNPTYLPTGTYITGFGTGNGSGPIGTYYLSAASTTAISGDTITGIFTGIGAINSGQAPSGPPNSIPFGSAGTMQLYNPAAMCGRVINITPSGGSTSIVWTIQGADIYGFAQTEQITTAGSAVSGKKAWKYIQSVTPGVADGTNNYTVGTIDTVGLPLRSDIYTAIAGLGLDVALYYNGAAIAATTGWTKADLTAPTATTGDVRGTYGLQSASNGTKVLIAVQSPSPANMGVQMPTHSVGMFGQPNYTTI